MTAGVTERTGVRFDLVAAGCLRLSDTTAVVHVRGHWRGGRGQQLGWPDLILDDGRRELRFSPLKLPDSRAAIVGADQPWAGMYAVPLAFFRRVRAPTLSLEAAGAATVLPGAGGAWERWARALELGERPAALIDQSSAVEEDIDALRGAVAGAEPLVAAGVGLIVMAAAVGTLPILALRPDLAPLFVALGVAVAAVLQRPMWAMPTFIGLAWATIPASFFGGLPSPVESLGSLLLIYAFWRALTRLELARDVLLFCVLVFLPVLASWAAHVPETSPPIGRAQDLAFLVITAFTLSRLSDAERVAKALTLTCIVLGAGALWSVVVGPTALFPLEVDEFGVEAPRAAGPFGESNFFALSLAALVPLALYTAAQSAVWRVLGLAAVVLAFGGIVAAGSRGSLLAAFCGLAGMALFAGNLGPAAKIIRIGAIATVVGAVALVPLLLQSQIESSTERTVSGRATENLVALVMFSENLPTGIGIDQYPVRYRDFTRRYGNDDRSGRYPHSLPLEIAAEQGLGGIVGWSAAFLLVLGFVRRYRVWHVPIGRALLISIGAFLVGSLFLHSSQIRLLYMLIGAVFAVGWAARAARPEGRPA